MEGRTVADSKMPRRDYILELAAQLFAEKGLAVTTVRDIGTAAGILSGSLYYHFESKEAIIKEIVTRYLRDLIDSYERALAQSEHPRERLEGLIQASFEAIEHHQAPCAIFQNEYKTLQGLHDFPELAQLTARVQSLWLTTINEGVACGMLRSDVEARIFYRFARDAIWFTVRWYRPGGTDSVAALTKACSSILLNGFAAAP